jgi:hypothetical protein
VLARPSGGQLGEPVDLGEHAASECPLRLVVPASAVPRAWLRGRVVRPAAHRNAPTHVTVLASTGQSVRVKCDDDGAWSAGPAGRGAYRVFVESDGVGTMTLEPLEVSGTDDVDTGVCTLPVPGTLEVTAVDEHGARRPDAWFRVSPLGDDRRGGSLDVRDGAGRGNVPPGRWRVATWGDTPFASIETEVRAGEVTAVHLPVAAGVPFTLRVPPELDRRKLRVAFRDAGGRLLRELTMREARAGKDESLSAPPGSYALEVDDGAGGGGKVTATIELREAGQVVELPVPPLAEPQPRSAR